MKSGDLVEFRHCAKDGIITTVRGIFLRKIRYWGGRLIFELLRSDGVIVEYMKWEDHVTVIA